MFPTLLIVWVGTMKRIRPAFNSDTKKLHTFSPILFVVSSAGVKGATPSGRLTLYYTYDFDGSICI